LTLVELLIAMAIFAIIMVPMVLLLTGVGVGFNESSRRAELQRRGRMALEAMVAVIGQAGADPTGMNLFEAITEAAPSTVVVAADLRGDEPGAPPDGDSDDRAERMGFRLVPGGGLMNEVSDPAEPFGRSFFELSRDVRDFRVIYRNAAGEVMDPEVITEDKPEGVLARRRIRSLEITLVLAPPDDPGFAPVVLQTTVTPVNLASRYLGAAAGGGFPLGEESGGAEGPSVPGEGAPPQGPPELVSQGAAAYDADGTVRQVEFYLDDRVLGVDGYAPYDALVGGWNPISGGWSVPDGHHPLYALV